MGKTSDKRGAVVEDELLPAAALDGFREDPLALPALEDALLAAVERMRKA